MQEQRAIIVDGSRLVCDLLRRVIEKTPEFKVVREIKDWEEIPIAIQKENADWLFVVLSPGEKMPDMMSNELFLARPMLKIIAFWTDGSHVRTEWLGRQERDFTDLTLDGLTNLIQREFWVDLPKDFDQGK